VDRTEDSSTYTYLHGETYTNHIWQDYQEDRTYSTGYKDNVPGHTRILSTNSASAPWVNGGLDYGTQRDFGTYVQHRWWTNILISNWINSSWDVPSSNYLATYDDSGEWPMVAWSYSVTNYSAGETSEREETANVTSIARLATSGGTNGSALFCLTGTVKDLGLGVALPLTSGWTIASNAPDTSGRVFLILGNGTTNDATVKLDDSLTNSVTNWNYSVGAARVDLGMEWKGPNDTNWHSDWPLYVLKDTTVQFRVTTPGFTGVAWPTGYPQWSNGSNGVTQISMTFNSVSSDTNGQWVTVTAGSMASNRVVVFDYEVKFQPAEGPGRFEGRETYPTGYGVGETVDFVAAFNPSGVTVENVGGVVWTASGMHYDSSYLDDLSITNATGIELGAFEETDQVTGTLSGGISAGASRTNHLSSWLPTAALLKDLMLTNSPAPGRLLDWPHVGHDANSISCRKRAAYFLYPQTNAYYGVLAREGTGSYQFSNGSNSIVDNVNTTQITFSLTNGAGTVTAGPNTVPFTANPAEHPVGGWNFVQNVKKLVGGAVEANFWGIDEFGGGRPTVTGVLPSSADHIPVILTTLSVPIVIQIKLRTDAVYTVDTVTSRRDYFSTGRMDIEKKGSGVGSGPHSKGYADGDSIK
jgi:hypothetical protein